MATNIQRAYKNISYEWNYPAGCSDERWDIFMIHTFGSEKQVSQKYFDFEQHEMLILS